MITFIAEPGHGNSRVFRKCRMAKLHGLIDFVGEKYKLHVRGDIWFVKANDSHAWKSLVQGKHWEDTSGNYLIVDGCTIKFWSDSWTQFEPLKILFFRPWSTDHSTSILLECYKEDLTWDENIVGYPISEWLRRNIGPVVLNLQGTI